MLIHHLIAFVLGAALDLLIGDPQKIPHPVQMIGWLTEKGERLLYPRTGGAPGSGRKADTARRAETPEEKKLLRRGAALVVLVLSVTAAVSALLLLLFYRLHPWAGIAAEAVMTGQILAARSLIQEGRAVRENLERDDLPGARRAVGRIVGRDTEVLDRSGVIRAAVETVAESTSDGVVAPMLFTALGGPVLGFVYKAVNTMDSMIGYRSERYLFFGRAAARTDDVFNYLPARISAVLLLAASFLCPRRFDGRHAFAVWRRDRRRHASPNAGQTESVCAGALHLQLGGPTQYGGKIVDKPYLGDPDREPEPGDIGSALWLMFLAAVLCALVCTAVLGGLAAAL